MTTAPAPRIPLGERDAFVLIVDISGYTDFIKYSAMEMSHAQEALSALMGAMWDAGSFDLEPLKTEGDAILFAGADDPARVAAGIERILAAYYRAREARNAGTECTCRACSSLPRLEVKMLGHHGPVLFYRFKGGRDIAGLTVVTVHRMLKNSIAGTRYVALSGPACTVPLALGPREDTVESYPDVGELTIAVQRFDPAPWLAAASGAAAKPAGRLRSLIGRITGR